MSFLKRTQPLVDIDTQQQEIEADFNKRWETQEISDWEENISQASANGNGLAGIWCAACTYSTLFQL